MPSLCAHLNISSIFYHAWLIKHSKARNKMTEGGKQRLRDYSAVLDDLGLNICNICLQKKQKKTFLPPEHYWCCRQLESLRFLFWKGPLRLMFAPLYKGQHCQLGTRNPRKILPCLSIVPLAANECFAGKSTARQRRPVRGAPGEGENGRKTDQARGATEEVYKENKSIFW